MKKLKKKDIINLRDQKQRKLEFWLAWLLSEEICDDISNSYIYDMMLDLRIDVNLLNAEIENK